MAELKIVLHVKSAVSYDALENELRKHLNGLAKKHVIEPTYMVEQMEQDTLELATHIEDMISVRIQRAQDEMGDAMRDALRHG